MSIWSIVIAIIMLGVLVTIHELGHFWVARLLKIKAYEVSIFVGPKLVDWRRNDVEYSIRALPFGAYVRFNDFDENGNVVESDDPSLLVNQPRWKRLIVALAGPFMNLLLGVIIFSVLFSIAGYATLEVGAVRTGSQLETACLSEEIPFEIGDTIVAVNGERVMTAYDYMYEVDRGVPQNEPCTLTLRSRSTGDLYDVELVPVIEERAMIGIVHYPDIDGKYHGWEVAEVSPYQNNGDPILEVGDYLTHVDGVSVEDEGFEDYIDNLTTGDSMTLTYIRNGVEYNEECAKTIIAWANDRGPILYSYAVEDFTTFVKALKTAFAMPYTIINLSIKSIGEVFRGQEEVYNMVSGPIGMTTVVSDYVDDVDDSLYEKAVNIIQMAGIISIGLMFTNLLPIPGLDGNQLILIIFEMIMGRKLSKKSENAINAVGFVLLIGLVLFAFASDIIRIILD